MNNDEMLQKILALTEENNDMLHHLRNAQKWATVNRYVYWVLIIGLTIWSFYVIEPMFKGLMQNYQSLSGVNLNPSSFNLNSMSQGLQNALGVGQQ